jgi:hypothetical protein
LAPKVKKWSKRRPFIVVDINAVPVEAQVEGIPTFKYIPCFMKYDVKKGDYKILELSQIMEMLED